MKVLAMQLLIAATGLILASTVAADSLYEAGGYASLVSDIRAARPGDTLTVIVVESASANASAGADTARSFDIAGEMSGGTGSGVGKSARGAVGATTVYAGDGSVTRSGRLVARVSVTVERVLDNGNLEVSGAQELHFNQESQSIVVRGEVRPQDIAPDNSIESARLANSTIEYRGDGILAGTQRPSWIARLFGWLL